MVTSANNKGYKLLVMWLVSLAILGLAYFVVVFPIRQAAAEKKNEAAAMRQEVKRLEKYVSRENYERLLGENERLSEMLKNFVARNARANECGYIVSDIAGNVGVSDFAKMQNTSQKESHITNCIHIQKELVEVVFTGSYGKFLRLINEYERSEPIVVIDEFSITSAGRVENSVKMSLLILLEKKVSD